MSSYEQRQWDELCDHLRGRAEARTVPKWLGDAGDRAGQAARTAANRVADAVPDKVREPIGRASDALADRALRPSLESAVRLLELANDWAIELNDPKNVERIARRQGVGVATFEDLQGQDLKVCDRLLSRHTLKWRTVGAVEGGAMGILALAPVAGIPMALTADAVVIQVLSTSIASRVAYSYGYDARDPDERAFIERLVSGSFIAQAAKAKPLRDTAHAWHAVKNRVNWSTKLREDHRLLAALEKLLQQTGPAGSRVAVKDVAKFVPLVGVLIGAGMNAAILGKVAGEAQRHCQTRFLCDKYGLIMPAALAWATSPGRDDDAEGLGDPLASITPAEERIHSLPLIDL